MTRSTIGELIAQSDGSIKTGPFGTKLSASEYSVSGVPVISVGEIGYGTISVSERTKRVGPEVTARLAEYVLEAGDIVIGRKGAVDRSAWVRPHEHGYFLGSDGIRLRFGEGVDSRFMAYQFSTPRVRNWILQHAVGSTLASLNEPTLKEVPIDVPPIDVQRAIAATLGALEDKIESNCRLIQVAADLVKAQYTKAVAGRERGPFQAAMSVRMGSAFKGVHYTEPGVGRPLLRIRDLKTFAPQIWTTERRGDETVIEPGSIVVGMDAEFRSTLWRGDPAVLNQRVCAFRPIPPVGRAFVLHCLEADLALQERAKSGTTVIHLNKADIQGFRVPLLEADEHRVLAATTEPLLDLIVARSAESKRLAELRDVLMPEMLSGRLRVNDASQLRMGEQPDGQS